MTGHDSGSVSHAASGFASGTLFALDVLASPARRDPGVLTGCPRARSTCTQRLAPRPHRRNVGQRPGSESRSLSHPLQTRPNDGPAFRDRLTKGAAREGDSEAQTCRRRASDRLRLLAGPSQASRRGRGRRTQAQAAQCRRGRPGTGCHRQQPPLRFGSRARAERHRDGDAS